MKISENLVLVVWTLISILLIGLYAMTVHIQIGTVFFLMLNAINAALIILVLLFRRKIKIILSVLRSKYETLKIKTSKNIVHVEYKYESKFGQFFVALVSLTGIYLAILSLLDIQAYRWLIKEDGIIEYASFLFWILAALTLFSSLVASKLKQRVYNFQILSHMLLILFFIVCAGEEISWGQRIFDLGTPDLLGKINVQNEITLHNIGSISLFSNAFFLLTLCYLFIVPYVRSKNLNIKRFTDYYALPTPNRFVAIVYCVSFSIWVFLGIRFGTLGFHPFSFYPENYYTQMDDEVFEFLMAYSFFCFSVMDSLKRTRLEEDP